MLVCTITPGATTAGQAIPMTGSIQTNNNVSIKNNVINILQPGVYEITATANITSTASGMSGIAIYSGGNQLGISGSPGASASGSSLVSVANAFIDVKRTCENSYAQISIMPVNAPTIVSGDVSVKRIT